LQLQAIAVSNLRTLVICLTVGACASDPSPPAPAGDDLGLGDVGADDLKADGDWGAALTCPVVPDLPPLIAPRITLSIDGLTLHLTDAATGFDKVYPVGPGTIDDTATDPEFGESRSYYPVIASGGHDFAITPATIQPCKTWWTDAATGEKRPVFAGLPFMSFAGNYAIHGPIDNFRAANGGTLRRGYVSHGCFRMEAADVLEVYARIRGVARVPVHVQREHERTPTGAVVDLAQKWVGARCAQDADCNYAGGFCAANSLSGGGFCSARCTTYCADRPGNPATFCIDDPAAPGRGMCVPKAQPENFACRPYDHLKVAPLTPRRGQAGAATPVTATVCRPGSPGWVGDHCRADADCGNGTTCRGATATTTGVCSMACDRLCPDQPGWSDTFCASAPSLGAGGSCVRACTRRSNASECPGDQTCGAVLRNGQATTRDACVSR
jgi:hypothetical protein